jgi:hypothetical protein
MLQQTQARTRTAAVKADKVPTCQAQEQAISTTLGRLNARVRAAQATNDPAQMRATLAEVQQQQTAMQEQLAMCLERRESARHGHERRLVLSLAGGQPEGAMLGGHVRPPVWSSFYITRERRGKATVVSPS